MGWDFSFNVCLRKKGEVEKKLENRKEEKSWMISTCEWIEAYNL